MSGEETRDILLQTTLRLLAREGFQAVTARRIAREAGTNVAAVNYHFGSKDALVSQAAALFAARMRGLFGVLHEEGLNEQQRFAALIHQFADQLIEYPGFLRTFIAAIMQGQEPPDAAKANIMRGRELMLAHIAHVFGGSEEEINNQMIQLMSTIVYPILLGRYAGSLYGVPLDDPEYRRRYIDQLIRTFGLESTEDE